MNHLKSFENFDPTNEELKDKLKLVGDKIKNKVSKLRSLKWSDIRSYGSKLWDSVKRESKETKQAVKILQRMIDNQNVSDNEKRFLREQSKDLIKIIGTGVTPTPIVAIIAILGKKYNFNIFPGDQEELKRLIEKEKQELGITIDEEESPQ